MDFSENSFSEKYFNIQYYVPQSPIQENKDYNSTEQNSNELDIFFNNNREENDEQKENLNDMDNDITQTIEKEQNIKRKRGRKTMNNCNNYNIQNSIHDKNSKDNLNYKVKTQSLKCIISFLNQLLKKKKSKLKLYKINGKILKRAKKEENIYLFNMKIKDILSLERTDKVKKNWNSNVEIIRILEKNKIMKEFLEIKFIEFIENIYVKLNSKQFKKKFGVENKFLLKEKTMLEEDKNQIENFIKEGILNYFEKKKSRNKIIDRDKNSKIIKINIE
jgi:hypothetical protein